MMQRLKAELLENEDARTCLPCNLTDEWLDSLADSASRLLDGSGDETADPALVIGVLIRILEAKTAPRSTVMELTDDELMKCLVRYRVELALETVHRKTDVTYNPATLETILTERKIITWKKTESKEGL
ncbi:hypothetical protein [Burkholderia multivorans]|uniref:hypothetical protein n=1 Tax=Burkholderia multivorans TaxID=87883 RepID=UPI0012DABFDC|nr:hypothetical protein [Burkholderia multivorans]